jgi:hypothetical protein
VRVVGPPRAHPGRKGGRFSQPWETYAETAVPLPGGEDHWPIDVKADGKPAIVVSQDGAPTVRLAAGRHVVTGAFAWPSLPPSLTVSSQTGLVALSLRGKRVEFPSRGEGGELFLEAAAAPEAAEADRLDISVHRRLTDGVPLLLATRLTLAVSGKMREVALGKALPAGFVAHALESDLPARVEPDGRLRVQLRPGTHTLTLIARHEARAKAITRPAPDGLWKEGDEVWVFEAQPSLRVVTIEGVAGIDPSQTTLPADWRSFPAYVMTAGATMTLAEQRRGDAEPAPDQLSLRRHLWLDFDGGGFSARDDIEGRLTRSWRLEMGEESTLGHVAAGGTDQFITRSRRAGPRASRSGRRGWPCRPTAGWRDAGAASRRWAGRTTSSRWRRR